MKITRLFSIIICAIMVLSVLAGCKSNKTETPSPSGGAGRTVVTDTSISDVVSDSDSETEKETETETETEIATEVPTESTETESETESETEKPKDPSATGVAIATLAKSLIGSQFEMGATGPERFDNSGFVYYCCAQNGVYVPRLAGPLASAGTGVSLSDLAPGDILVFSADVGGDPAFVAIYVGNNSFVAAFKPERPTNIQAIDGYWSARFITARRVG